MNYQDLVNEFGFDLWPQEDRQQGRVGSAMPAWYFGGHISEEERMIDSQEATLRHGLVRRENEYSVRKQTEAEREKLDKIKRTFPRPEGAQKDHLRQIHLELGERIAESMFAYTDMMKGTATPHDELGRAKNPVLTISRPVARWIMYCNGRVVDGSPYKTSRDDATRAWKIAGKILGENTYSEILRPMERPKGSRPDMPYFGPTEPSKNLEIQKPEPVVVAMEENKEVVESVSKEPRTCTSCGANIDNEHHMALRCKECRGKK